MGVRWLAVVLMLAGCQASPDSISIFSCNCDNDLDAKTDVRVTGPSLAREAAVPLPKKVRPTRVR